MKKESKENSAIEAATAVFTRFGYAKTTMGDIAAEAGMSRPALYLLFPDKQAVFDRVIERMDREKLKELREALPGLEGIAAKLSHACTSWGLDGVQLAEIHPDSADLFDLRFSAVKAVYANFQALITELIQDAVARSTLRAKPEDVARTIVHSLRGLREGATGVDDMRRLIDVQVAILVAALAPDST
ncbi:TetR/AcrR family transcriptional regulator [Rhodopseudomonas boonkerdii]|uniref:TetR/AcrR family transcriptional regulator n=1 Tax=Rhodopseudomonas boonkerdii TaxID=475937 RepID=UPI001E3BDECC|nr:TetR/AcrR family transcriptional regulator [Rhodopseudomonas boonkerdii]UGV28453.1 TetR/AcrR family transcriptional regulator [Rhodopseudomonas boonkerdii]